MDETDLLLMAILFQNSRTPYSALADRLKLSIPAVHKRVSALQETGIIMKFSANLSVGFLKAVRVYAWGTSEIYPPRAVVESLRKDDRVDVVVTGSGNSVYVRALLPAIQDLEPLVAFFRKAAAVASPAIAIEATETHGSSPPRRPPPEAADARPIDYRILQALHDDARKPIADICDELHLSPKTVRNRLRRLIQDGVVEFSLDYQLGEQAGVVAYLLIILTPEMDTSAFRGRLASDLAPRILWSLTASNLPSTLVAQTWSPTLAAHEELAGRVNAYPGVRKVEVSFVSRYEFFESWRDKLLRKRAEAAQS